MKKTVDKDKLLDEIAHKVIELDEQKKYDERLRGEIRDHIDALDEMTDLDREEIEALAERIVNTRSKGLKPAQLVVVVCLFISVVAAGIFFMSVDRAEPRPLETTTLSKLRPQYVQEKLAVVLNATNALKVNFLEHWMATGKSPSNFEELGMHKEDFVDGEAVKDLIFTDRAIKIFLGDDVGDDIWLELVPDIQENRVQITWQCYTNIPQKLLGAKKAALCWSQQ